MGNLLNQLLYAIKFRTEHILLSDRVTAESQILYDRDPRERVEKVAPFLTLDGDPYPAVVDGRGACGSSTATPRPTHTRTRSPTFARGRHDRLA